MNSLAKTGRRTSWSVISERTYRSRTADFMPSQAMTADAVSLEPFAKPRFSNPIEKASEIHVNVSPKDIIDGGTSLMSSSRNLARWKHARPGFGEAV